MDKRETDDRSDDAHRTKYERVVQDLSLRIERGEHKPDTPLPPIRELMATYGYSLATITRAISILESQGLLRSTRGKGIFVQPQRATATLPMAVLPTGNDAPQNPVWGRLRVAVLSTFNQPRPSEMWWTRILAGADQAVRETGGVAQIRLVSVGSNRPADVVAQCVNEGVNAILNLGDHWEGVALLELSRAVRARRLPAVMAWTSQPRPLPLHVIELDNQLGVEAAVDHLVQLGHRAIGFLGFEGTYAWVAERAQAFRVAMASHRLQPACELAVARREHPEGWPELGVFARGITAAVCANDDLATALVMWADAERRRVPEALSVVGFDDDPLYRQHELTTVHDDLPRIGYEAVRLLGHLLLVGDVDTRLNLRLPTRLVVRRSSGPAPQAETGPEPASRVARHAKRAPA